MVTSMTTERDNAQSREPATKMLKPTMYDRLWPYRSPARPTPRSSALTTSRYTAVTHSISATLACSSARITGSTVFTTLPSSADMNVPTPTVKRIHQRRSEAGVELCSPATIVSQRLAL
jgi:hypothetical protein